MTRRRELERPHVVGGGLAGFGGPGLALAAVVLLAGLAGTVYLVGQVEAGRTGATYHGPLLAHLADVGGAWQPQLNSARLWAIAGGAYATVLWLAVTAVVWLRGRRDRPREVRWAQPRDLKRAGLTAAGPQPGRVIVGRAGRRRLVATPPTHSLVVFGPSGSGKTSAFAVPAVLEWDGPAVVSSVKTDLLHITRQPRGQTGPVLVYDPLDRLEDPQRCGWNPLDRCETYPGAQALAAALMSLSDFGRVEHGDFWQASAQSLLGPLLLAARRAGAGIREVRRWLNTGDWDTPGQWLADDPEAAEALTGATAHTPRDTALSYVATARVALRAYETPAAVASTTLVPQVDLDALLDGRQTLYLVGDEDDQRILRPLFVGLVDAIMRHAARRVNRGHRADKPLLVLLDDAANSAPLQDLDRYAAVCRDRSIQLVTVWQDLAQIEDRYSHDRARTIVNNHQAKMLLPGVTDRNLLDYISGLLGEERIIQHTSSTDGRPGSGLSASEAWQPLATPDELRRLPADRAVLVHGSNRPARLRLRPYYHQAQWRHLGSRWRPGPADGAIAT